MTGGDAALRNATSAEAAAHAAITSFVRRSLVLVVFTKQGQRTPHHGSGTLIVDSRGRVAVLTAAHVVRDQTLVSIITADSFLQDVAANVVVAPRQLDIGVVFLHPAIADAVRHLALAFDQIEDSDRHRIEPDTQLVVAGFPEQFTHDASLPTGATQHRFTDIIQYTTSHGHDNRRISIAWKQGEMTGGAFPFDELGVPRDRVIPFKKPKGLSGGPVFRVRATRKDLLWSPSSDVMLVGIAVDFTARRELALPWWCWRSWLDQAFGEPVQPHHEEPP